MKATNQLTRFIAMIFFIALFFLLAGLGKLFGQNNFEYLQTDSKETSRWRPNIYYTGPFGIKGYTYVEFYNTGDSFFGQTFLTKEIKGIFGVEVNTYYASFFSDYVGIGPKITVPTDKSTLLTFSLIPAFIEFNGKYKRNYVLGEFVFFKEFNIPSLGKWRINSFGVINLASKGGPTWDYGEVYLEKPVGIHLFLGTGADLFCNTKWYPNPNWGAKIGYSF